MFCLSDLYIYETKIKFSCLTFEEELFVAGLWKVTVLIADLSATADLIGVEPARKSNKYNFPVENERIM